MEIDYGLFGPTEIILLLMVGACVAVFLVLPFWFICKKAGFSPWLSLVVLLPFGLVILPFIMAFRTWKTPSAQQVEQGSETDRE